MHTERFTQLRKAALTSVFDRKRVASIWRSIVRDQLRNLDIRDLYDHYDFNYNIDERAQAIRSDILAGTYHVSLPLIYRIEKKFGICRHIVIPQPIDALVLQVLVESIADKLIKKQPSKNAFYSRDKHTVGKPHDVFQYGISLRKLWISLQKQIYKFNQTKELIIVTDLANYYDSINMQELRKVFQSLVKVNEVVVDLLFRVIEEISWKPDYLPYAYRGLPVSNLEAIRLLAHCFLFEIDAVIKQKTDNNFTRWMDDLVIGVDSRTEAIELISSVSDMLKSRGLALALAKTDIYDKEKGYFHFQIAENKLIDSIEEAISAGYAPPLDEDELQVRFKQYLQDRGARYWDKVAKRFITVFGKTKSRKLLELITDIYIEEPGLRPNLLRYLQEIGFGMESSAKILEILDRLEVFDDISLFQVASLITSWEIPIDLLGRSFVSEADKRISRLSFRRKNPSDFYSLVWLKAKYAKPDVLLRFIQKYANIWQSESFLRRQVTATLPRLLSFDKDAVLEMLRAQVSSGVPNAVTLANQIIGFSSLDKIDTRLSMYLFPTRSQATYPLPKFLVLCSVMNSESVRANPEIWRRVQPVLHDPHYNYWMRKYYGMQSG